ncbi:MAG TPA: diguanylate cyclase, partial [Arenimonas sp.]|nr:diguanylate cyclase [Arenimonas sp.]
HPIGLDSGLPPGLDVTVVRELADGRLAIGALSDGVFVQQGKRWIGLVREYGLPGFAPFFLADDDRGWFWVAGFRGIYRFSLGELDRAASGAAPGLQAEMLLNERGEPGGGQRGYCCNGAGNAKGLIADGVLWLPSRDGLVSLSADDVRRNTLAPPVRIERMQALGQWRTADGEGDWQLPPEARDLAFEFTGLSLQEPLSVELRYRLRGYDRDWHRLDDPSQRQANYTNLPPGDYVFEAIAANNAGIWSSESAQLAFRIQPYFHETRLFQGLLALLLVSIVYAGYRWQRIGHQQQRDALAALVRQRTDALEASNRRLEEASQIDAVTGLRNRRFVANQLPADIAYYERERSKPERAPDVLVFAVLQLDHLDTVRREFGDVSAEHMLQQAAGLLARWLRSGDYVARWSDEEFLLVFRPLPIQHLAPLGHRICHALAQQAFAPDAAQTVALEASLGLVECPLFREARGRSGWEQIVGIAARAKSYASERGGNGWAALRPRPGQDIDHLRSLAEGDIAEAARRHELDLLSSAHLRPTAPGTDVH